MKGTPHKLEPREDKMLKTFTTAAFAATLAGLAFTLLHSNGLCGFLSRLLERCPGACDPFPVVRAMLAHDNEMEKTPQRAIDMV